MALETSSGQQKYILSNTYVITEVHIDSAQTVLPILWPEELSNNNMFRPGFQKCQLETAKWLKTAEILRFKLAEGIFALRINYSTETVLYLTR